MNPTPLINYPNTMTEPQAKREAVDILEEEANQLCDYGVCGNDDKAKLPHRARIAISREIARLRLIAQTLKSE